MKIATRLYKFDSREMKQAAEACVKSLNKLHRQAIKMCLEVGGNGTVRTQQGNNFTRVVGFHFDKMPDRNLWVRLDREWNGDIVCRPRKLRKAAQELCARFEALLRWSTRDLEKLVKWDDFTISNGEGAYNFYTFNFFQNRKKKFYGFAVPVFSPKIYKKNPEAQYQPVKGLKEISFSHYERIIEA